MGATTRSRSRMSLGMLKLVQVRPYADPGTPLLGSNPRYRSRYQLSLGLRTPHINDGRRGRTRATTTRLTGGSVWCCVACDVSQIQYANTYEAPPRPHSNPDPAAHGRLSCQAKTADAKHSVDVSENANVLAYRRVQLSCVISSHVKPSCDSTYLRACFPPWPSNC